MQHRFLFLIAFLLLPACGYAPVHGSNSAAATRPAAAATNAAVAASTADFSQIRLAQLSGRRGQKLQNLLIDRFYQTAYPQNPAYSLEISLSSGERGLGVQKDAVTTRYELVTTAGLVLRDAKTNEELYRTTARSRVSYNVLDAQYATLISAEDAENRALQQLADDITRRISLYFKREPRK